MCAFFQPYGGHLSMSLPSGYKPVRKILETKTDIQTNYKWYEDYTTK